MAQVPVGDKRTLAIPIIIITVGVGWLLTTLKVAPGIDWIWTLGLAVVGVLTFALGGWNKVTFVLGLFFVVGSGLSVLRQTEGLALDHEVPILVIILGVLLLIARSPGIPAPEWLVTEPDPQPERPRQ